MKIYLLRHAKTKDTENGINGSRTDTPLSETGREEAGSIVSVLGKNVYNVFIVSPLCRTVQTIQPFLSTISNPRILVSNLTTERDLGLLTNSTKEEFKKYLADHGVTDRIAWQPPQGESTLQVGERAKEFLSYLKNEHAEESVLICGHQNFLRCLELLILERQLSDFYSDNPARLKPLELRVYDVQPS